MGSRSVHFALAIFGVATILAPHVTSHAAAQGWRFHLEEATIADVHRAIRAKQITVTQLVNLYFKRIEAYNGTCVKGEADPATGLMLGDLTPIENAGQINAYMTLNIRGKRSKPIRPTTIRKCRTRLKSHAPRMNTSCALDN